MDFRIPFVRDEIMAGDAKRLNQRDTVGHAGNRKSFSSLNIHLQKVYFFQP